MMMGLSPSSASMDGLPPAASGFLSPAAPGMDRDTQTLLMAAAAVAGQSPFPMNFVGQENDPR